MWEREQWAAKDDSLGIAALYEMKSLHETRGFRVRSLRSTVCVPALRGEGQDFLDICNVFFKESAVGSGARGGSDTVKGGVDKSLDEGRVARGWGDTEMANPWRGDMDGNFILLGTVLNDNVDSSGGIIRDRFLFLWANINGSSMMRGTVGGLSSVSASFRHGGRYARSHT